MPWPTPLHVTPPEAVGIPGYHVRKVKSNGLVEVPALIVVAKKSEPVGQLVDFPNADH
jgi:hypothetical protein